MCKAFEAFELCNTMVDIGNPNSVSDAGVGALCIRSAVMGAYLNVKINASSLKDKVFVDDILQKADDLLMKTKSMEETILTKVNNKL